MRKSSATVWLAAALIVALAGNGILLFILRQSYEAQLVQQIWPPESKLNQDDLPARADNSRSILLLGDSRMAEWNFSPPPGIQAINAGLPGLTSAQLRGLAPSVLDRVQPEVVVLQIGINDLKLVGVRTIWRQRVVTDATENIAEVVAACRRRGIRVILLDTWPTGPVEWSRRMVWNAAVPEAVRELNQRLRSRLASEDGVVPLDLFERAGLAAGRATHRDAVHLRAGAYDPLSRALRAELEAMRPAVEESQSR